MTHRADESPPEEFKLWGWLVLGGLLLGALIFYAHAKRVGGAAEDHIGWQTGLGSLIGLMTGFLLATAVEEYRKGYNNSDRTYTVSRWFRTGNGVALIFILLFILAFAILVIIDPNEWTSLPTG